MAKKRKSILPTPETDRLLVKLVAKHGTEWDKVAARLDKPWTPERCKKRYSNLGGYKATPIRKRRRGQKQASIDLTGKISSSGGGTGTSGFDSYSLHGLSDSGNEGKNTESRRSKNGNRKGDRGVNENKDAGASDPATDTGADITPPSSQKAREQKTEQSSRKRGRGGLGNAMVEAIEISSEYDEEKTDEEEHSVTGAAPGKGKGKEKGKGSSTGEGGRRLPPASTKAKDDAKERHFDGDQEARGEGVEEEKADAVGGGGGVMIGVEATPELKQVASKRLSRWAQRFISPRVMKEQEVPELEPMNDEYLEGFGRSYREAELKWHAREEGSGGAAGVGAAAGGGGMNDGSSTSEEEVDSNGDLKEWEHDALGSDREGNGTRKRQRRKRRGMGGGAGGVGGAYDAAYDTDGSGTGESGGSAVFLANLPYEMCTEQVMRETFGVFGKIIGVRIAKRAGDVVSGRATVVFKYKEAANQTVDLVQGECIGGRPIKASHFTKRKFGKLGVSRYFVNPAEAVEASSRGVTCTNCGKRGHNAEGCLQSSMCILCAAPGHMEEDCPNMACLQCWGQGHTEENCPEPTAHAKLELCHSCGNAGHTIIACPSLGTDPAEARCMSCGKGGHYCCSAVNVVLREERRRDVNNRPSLNRKPSDCANCGKDWHIGSRCTGKTHNESLEAAGGDRVVDANGFRRTEYAKVRCHNCGGEGHMMSSCPKRRARTPGPPVRRHNTLNPNGRARNDRRLSAGHNHQVVGSPEPLQRHFSDPHSPATSYRHQYREAGSRTYDAHAGIVSQQQHAHYPPSPGYTSQPTLAYGESGVRGGSTHHPSPPQHHHRQLSDGGDYKGGGGYGDFSSPLLRGREGERGGYRGAHGERW